MRLQEQQEIVLMERDKSKGAFSKARKKCLHSKANDKELLSWMFHYEKTVNNSNNK